MHPATTLKVLQISPEYPPYHVGGGGIVVQSIAQKLSKRGHCVSVIAGYYPTKHGFERTKVIKDGQVDVYLLPLVPTPRLPFQLKTVMPPNILSLFNLTKILLRQKFDIIHLHGFGHFIIDISAFICRMTGRQYVVTLHGFPHSPYKAGRIFRFLYRLYSVVLGSLTLLKATHITAVSSAVRTEAEFYGINEVEIIPNGIDLDQFYEIQPISDIRASLGVQQDDLLIVAIGILHERKGFQYLIEALALVKKFEERTKLILIGEDGGYAKKLQEIANNQQVKDSIVFTGYVESKFKCALIAEAEIFVIPSLIESFGLVALEAMAMGKPIIASKVGGLTSIFEDEKTALIIKPRSPCLIAEAIIRLIKDPDLRIMLSANSKGSVKKFAWNLIIERYLTVYMKRLLLNYH